MINRFSSKKGYSLMETVIAFTLITIAFAIAMTTAVTSFKVRMRVANTKFFITETSNYLECYKMHGSVDFYDNAVAYLDCGNNLQLVQNNENGKEFVIYYSADYKKLNSSNGAAFTMHIFLDNSFSAFVTEYSTGKNVYYLRKPFVSHYDL